MMSRQVLAYAAGGQQRLGGRTRRCRWRPPLALQQAARRLAA